MCVCVCVCDQLDSEEREEPAGSSREPQLAFWAYPLPTGNHLSLPPRVFPISQVSIPTGSVPSQVYHGKGADKLIPVEDLGDNKLKGSPHPLQGHLHVNGGLCQTRRPPGTWDEVPFVGFSALRPARRDRFMGLMNLSLPLHPSSHTMLTSGKICELSFLPLSST